MGVLTVSGVWFSVWWAPWVLLAAVVVVAAALIIVLARHRALRETVRRRNAMAPAPQLGNDGQWVLSVLRSASVVLDAEGEIVHASPAAYSLGLVRADELVSAAARELVAEVRATGQIVERELEIPRNVAGAATLLVRVRVAPIGRGRILVLAEDSTEAHRLDTIRRDFVVNVSHELKTPVSAIALLAETIQTAANDPAAVLRFSGQMQEEAQRLSVLVHEIIELARIQATGALADVRSVVLADVIAEAVAREKTAAEAKGIAVVAARADDVLVYGDQALLVTAVRNLLDNAISYSAANSRIGIGVREKAGMVEIAVVDQGIGISESDQARVFERFYRADPARSRVSGGTGLGLSIVKHIAADHGGSVSVWSMPGRGATFTLSVPAAGTSGLGEPGGAPQPDQGGSPGQVREAEGVPQ